MPQNRTEGLRIEWTQPARCVVPQWASVSPSSAKHGSRSPGAPRARRSLGRTRRGPSTSRGPAAHCHAACHTACHTARWFTVNDWGSLPAITRGIIIWAKKYCFSLGFHSLRGSKLLKVYIPVFFIKRKKVQRLRGFPTFRSSVYTGLGDTQPVICPAQLLRAVCPAANAGQVARPRQVTGSPLGQQLTVLETEESLRPTRADSKITYPKKITYFSGKKSSDLSFQVTTE